MNSFKGITIKNDSITLDELISIHIKCDDDFIPKLSSRVNIVEYCNKLFKKSKIISLHKGEMVVGILAIYCNDTFAKEAYISSICLLKDFRGLGYSSILMEKAIKIAKEKNFKFIKLEVGKNNEPAINLYKKFGYKKTDEKSETIIMVYEIQ